MFYSTSNLWKFEKQNIVVQYVAFDGPLEKNLREMEGWNTHCIVYTHNYSILWAQNWQWWAPDKSGSCATMRMTSGERPKPMSGSTCLSIPIITHRAQQGKWIWFQACNSHYTCWGTQIFFKFNSPSNYHNSDIHLLVTLFVLVPRNGYIYLFFLAVIEGRIHLF